ncbi:MAG: AAA family ATPase [Rhodobacteraceae bacterium]|nr:AAA family ATPase [Paracoccaceae bacterium]
MMNPFSRKYLPTEVFTPRAATVNENMYVDRSDLEAVLKKHAVGTRHLIIHGESGNGKTWLYKKVFADIDLPYLVVNLANASRLGSLQAALKDKLAKRSPDERLSQKVIQKSGGASVQVISADYSDQRIFEMVEREPLEALMALLRREAGKKTALIVLDNFEQIIGNRALIKELSDALILLDDDDYAKFNVRFCIVGVPSDIRDYLAEHSAIETVANRVVEIPEVARLTQHESEMLVEKGFSLLNIACDKRLVLEIIWKTDRIAQHLHELGLEIAQRCAMAGSAVSDEILETSIVSWVASSFSSVREALDHNLNARDTKAGRRNQVIYALGCLKLEDFKYTDVEEAVRKEFSESTRGVTLNVVQTLSALAGGDFPLIKRVPKGDAYRFVNPKLKIAIRVILHKVSSGKAEKLPRFT